MCVRMKSLGVSMLLVAAGCTQMTTSVGGATEQAICRSWGEALPTRSRSDTDQTQDEIGQLYDTFEAACPAFRSLLPGAGNA